MDVVENDQQVLVFPWYFTVPAGNCLIVVGTICCENARLADVTNNAEIKYLIMTVGLGSLKLEIIIQLAF